MATGACPVWQIGRRVGHQLAAAGLRVFLEHTSACGAAGVGWWNICLRSAGRLDEQTNNPTNQPNERPAHMNVLQEYGG
ncbi:Hypothetical protein SMAX5B_015711 [Scophthalmus maximus]|uniref:Uncharacterized protein n=1 Tax=Scophthalmus maximus TaxID=52904 RepID=A0A2U9CYH8_SCOMX|nr:Hypothetical protein SMAX5B_015711 [Scophthalmus maximus]